MLRIVFVTIVFFAAISYSRIVPTADYLRSLPEFTYESDSDLISSFASFAEKFGKSYENYEEMIYRFKVFKGRMEEAEEMNKRAKKLGSTARYGVTSFSDVTQEEFKEKYLMKKMPEIPQEKMYPNYMEPLASISKLNSSGPPATFDWTDHPGTVTPVYNQGQCGSCWAFSATENHESRFARQHKRAAQEMSVQQILDCDAPGQYGCNGGWPYQAWEYIHEQGGQDLLSCYGYEGQVGNCRWNGGCNAGSLVSWSWIFPHNEDQMLLWLWGNAPISICVDAEQWSSYSGGIVLGSECATSTDHCVLATGWNMNSNPPYWIVRNSWGTGWGENGYIYLEYGADTCAMAQYPASCHTVNG